MRDQAKGHLCGALLAGASLMTTASWAQTLPAGQPGAASQPGDQGSRLQEVVVTRPETSAEPARCSDFHHRPDSSGIDGEPGADRRRPEHHRSWSYGADRVGGVSLPAFTLRGVTSYGVVPGSDKEVSQYLDGVYIGSATGSISELPDVDRIEVLKGPQGTLFGRDATAGAISIVTHTPTGKFDFHQELTGGNYDQFRSKTRLDLPAYDDLSASITFVHNERQGDIRNLAAGHAVRLPGRTRFQVRVRHFAEVPGAIKTATPSWQV